MMETVTYSRNADFPHPLEEIGFEAITTLSQILILPETHDLEHYPTEAQNPYIHRPLVNKANLISSPKRMRRKSSRTPSRSNMQIDRSMNTMTSKVSCKICYILTIRGENEKRHMFNVHTGEPHIFCSHEGCFAHFCSNRGYKRHLRELHGRLAGRIGNPKEKIQCPECSYSSNQKCNMKRHIRNKHGQADRFPCEYCLHVSKTKANLKVHLRKCFDYI